MDSDTTITMSKREFSTMLAALRFWQSKLGPDRLPAQANAHYDFDAYFEDGQRFAPLSVDEIDTLCERVSLEDILAEPFKDQGGA